MMLVIGSTISHYRIAQELGRGGMGVVYRAEDIRLGRHVALKFLITEGAGHPKSAERFQREARAASALNHPNICAVYDVDETPDGHPFMVMEHLDGQTLRDRIRDRKIELDELLDWATQIAEGLEAAHSKGIIHRDIKPGNVFLCPDGRVKILDFGLARTVPQLHAANSAADTAEHEGPLTAYGMVVGTAAYMSPEQARGEALDHRTDLFSFGAVIYEMATRQNAFSGATPAILFDSILNKSPVPSSELNPGIPQELDRIIAKTLEKNRASRYTSAAEIRADLLRMKTGAGAVSEQRSQAPSANRSQSIAVLPFADMSPEKDQEYFCDGLAEEIISALTRVSGLRVVSRTSSFRFRGITQETRRIGDQLQADTLLEGSVRKSSSRLRVTVQLVNAKDGFELWSERYDRKLEDVFAIQDEIAAGVAGRLKAQIGSGSLFQKHSGDFESYTLYMKGRYQWNKRTAETLRKAVEYFQLAIQRDPTYALAYVGLADSYGVLGYQEAVAPSEVMPLARAAAEKALRLDESLAGAHASLAYASMHYDWNWDAAEAGYRRSLELDPLYPTSRHWYALHLAAMGRFDESIATMKQAVNLDPFSLIINSVLGYVYYFSRNFDAAIEQGLKTLELDSRFSVAHFVLGLSYAQNGMMEKAISEFEQAVANWQAGTMGLGSLGYAYAKHGMRERALRIADEMKEKARNTYMSPYFMSLIFVGLQEHDEAFSFLERALEQRSSMLIFLNVDPQLDPLRPDTRFTHLVRRVGLPR